MSVEDGQQRESNLWLINPPYLSLSLYASLLILHSPPAHIPHPGLWSVSTQYQIFISPKQ